MKKALTLTISTLACIASSTILASERQPRLPEGMVVFDKPRAIAAPGSLPRPGNNQLADVIKRLNGLRNEAIEQENRLLKEQYDISRQQLARQQQNATPAVDDAANEINALEQQIINKKVDKARSNLKILDDTINALIAFQQP